MPGCWPRTCGVKWNTLPLHGRPCQAWLHDIGGRWTENSVVLAFCPSSAGYHQERALAGRAGGDRQDETFAPPARQGRGRHDPRQRTGPGRAGPDRAAGPDGAVCPARHLRGADRAPGPHRRHEPDHGERSYRGSGRLDGKRTVITGGDSGIGRAVAIAFAREGADVLVVHLESEQEDGDATVRLIEEAGRRGISVAADLREEQACRAVIDRAVEELGGIDVAADPRHDARGAGRELRAADPPRPGDPG